MTYLKKNSTKACELKDLALFVVILEGIPNLVMIRSSKKFMTTSLVDFFVGMDSTHMETVAIT
jgi:hypothetical protein